MINQIEDLRLDLLDDGWFEAADLLRQVNEYILFLQDKEARLEAVVAVLNNLVTSEVEETKEQILSLFDPILGA